MAKRRNGEGTIYTDNEGATWVQLSAGPDGRRPRRKVPPGVDPAEFKRQLEAERAQGRNLAVKAGTVAALIAQYLEVAQGDVTHATFSAYSVQASHVVRHYGDRQFDTIDFLAIKLLHGKLRRDGLGHAHTVHILRRLRTAFDLVLERMPGGRNPVDFRRLKLRRPKQDRETEEADYWRAEQIRALLRAADDIEARGGAYRYAIAWYLGFLLGLRRCEIAAVRWQDVDWKRGILHIRSHWVKAETGGYTLVPGTKNGLSFKQPLGPLLLARLRVQWELHQQDRRRPDWREQGYIVCREDGSPLDDLAGVNTRLSGLCRAAELPPCNPHKMRHSCASLISKLGYSEAVIAAVLNHISEATVTRGYTHADPATVREAIERLEAAILEAAAEGAKEAK